MLAECILLPAPTLLIYDVLASRTQYVHCICLVVGRGTGTQECAIASHGNVIIVRWFQKTAVFQHQQSSKPDNTVKKRHTSEVVVLV